MTDPISGYTNNITTTNGTTYFYSGAAAAKVVAMACVTLEASLAENKQQQISQTLDKLISQDSPSEIVITASVLATAGAIAGAVGTAATVAGTAAAVTSAATNVAGLALSSSSGDNQALEINVNNSTFTPVVCYQFETTGCSNASMCPPLLPGESGGMTVISAGSDPFQGNNDSVIELNYLVGSGFYTPEGSESPVELTDINAKVSFYYNNEKVWYPKYYIDNATSPMDTDDVDGLTAVCFIPNENSNAIGFTVCSSLVEKASGELDITFLPIPVSSAAS